MNTVDEAVADPADKATRREDSRNVKCVGLTPFPEGTFDGA